MSFREDRYGNRLEIDYRNDPDFLILYGEWPKFGIGTIGPRFAIPYEQVAKIFDGQQWLEEAYKFRNFLKHDVDPISRERTLMGLTQRILKAERARNMEIPFTRQALYYEAHLALEKES